MRLLLSLEELYDLAMYSAVFNQQLADCDRQLESSWSSAARIEVKNSIAALVIGNVTVPRYNNVNSSGSRLQVECGQIVQDINRNAADFEQFRFRQRLRA